MRRAAPKNTLVFIGTAVLVAGIDQLLKALVVTRMSPGESIQVFSGFYITYIRNEGAAFGLFKGSGQIIFFLGLFIVVMTLAWFFRARHETSAVSFVALGLIVGGAIGNLIDRIFRGPVVDYIEIWFWPVFNLADTAIVAGVIMMIIVLIARLSREQKNEKSTQ